MYYRKPYIWDYDPHIEVGIWCSFLIPAASYDTLHSSHIYKYIEKYRNIYYTSAVDFHSSFSMSQVHIIFNSNILDGCQPLFSQGKAPG